MAEEVGKGRSMKRDSGSSSANTVHRGDREVWSQTRLGWFREQLGPPLTGGYPQLGMELQLIERFVSLTGCEIIEIGCGDGRLTFQYARRARRVVALDPNAAEIERARAEADRIGAHNIRFLARPAHGRLPGAPFDVALFTWSL
jgi:2-polyprenyl-3-methyl-5-hydroxy-6-metoxy-1,4-benzoquinol methylase